MLLRPGHQFAAERVQGCYDSRGKGAHRDLPSRAPAALTAGALYTAALLVLPHRPGWGQIPVQKLATPTAQDFVQDVKAQIRRSGKSHADYPLVQGIATGTIPLRQLQGWITQDYVYRRHVPRLAMLRYLKCTDPEIARYLYEVVEEESAGRSTGTAGHVDLFYDLAEGLGVSRAQLENAPALAPAAAHVYW